MVRVNSFCGCCDLETGGKIFGWISAILALITAIIFGAVLIVLLESPEKILNYEDSEEHFDNEDDGAPPDSVKVASMKINLILCPFVVAFSKFFLFFYQTRRHPVRRLST